MEIIDQPNQDESPIKKQIFFAKPNLVIRVKALFLDSLVIVALMILFASILNGFNVTSTTARIICFASIILYEPILTALGGTIGHRAMGLRVKELEAYEEGQVRKNINIVRAIFRFLFKVLLGWISLLTIHGDDYGQSIHDKVGGSLVIYN